MLLLTEIKCLDRGEYHAHKVVKALFENDPRPLFSQTGSSIKVLSSSHPASTCFDETVEVLDTREVVVPPAGATIPFKIRYFPRTSEKNGNRQHKRGVTDPAEAKKRLCERLQENGAEVLQGFVNFEGVMRIEKDDGSCTFVTSHQILGIMKVTDSVKLSALLATGVGAGKFAGWGMLDMF